MEYTRFGVCKVITDMVITFCIDELVQLKLNTTEKREKMRKREQMEECVRNH